eukprot:1505909-Prymnesium_polylepis.1
MRAVMRAAAVRRRAWSRNWTRCSCWSRAARPPLAAARRAAAAAAVARARPTMQAAGRRLHRQ